MATRTISAVGGNWNALTAWDEAAVPTAADDVVATALSGNLTINVNAFCRSIDMTLYASGKTLTHAGGSTLSVGDASGGALNFSGAWTYSRGTQTTASVAFVSTSDNGGAGWPITSAGEPFAGVSFNGVGGKWVFQDAFAATTTGTMTVTAGTVDTNNQTISCGIFSSTGTGVRTLTLGSSAITCLGTATAWTTATVTNLTVTTNTATVTLSGAGATFNTGTKDWEGLSLVFSGAGVQTLTGAGTFANVTRTGTAAVTCEFAVSSNPTVTGTLTVTGQSVGPNRMLIRSSTLGTARTVTVDTTVTSTNADWQDITAAGSASWNLSAASGGSGDCGGNTGITFTTPVSRYAKAAGNWSATATWSATNGGAAGASAPLPQDSVFLTSTAGAGTYTVDKPRLGSDIDCTGFTRTFNLQALAASMYGSITLAAGVTMGAGVLALTLGGRGTHTISSAGKTFPGPVTVNAPAGGSYTLTDAFATAGNLTVTGGTFDTSDETVTCLTFISTGSVTRAVTLGTSTVNLTSVAAATVWNMVAGGMTFSGASSTIVITGASANTRTFIGGARTYGTLVYTVAASTGILIISGSNTFDTISVSGGVRTLRLTHATTTTVTTFDVFGTAGNLVSIDSSTAGSTTTQLTKAGGGQVVAAYISVKDINGNPGSTWYADPGGVDAGNNQDWTFGPAGGTDATATPTTVTAAAAVGSPAITAEIDAAATPTAVASVAAVGSPTTTAGTGTTAAPSTVAAVTAVAAPATSVTSTATATPTTVSAAAAVSAPFISTGQRATPSTAAAVAAVATPAVTAPSNVTATPAVVTATATVGGPAVSTAAGATATPTVVAAVAAIAGPAVTAPTNQTATPTEVAAVAAIGAPTTSATSSTTANPTVVAAAAAIGSPTSTVGIGATPTPAVVQATATVGAPTVTSFATSVPATVALLAAIGAPTVSTGSTAHPATVFAIGEVGAPTVVVPQLPAFSFPSASRAASSSLVATAAVASLVSATPTTTESTPTSDTAVWSSPAATSPN